MDPPAAAKKISSPQETRWFAEKYPDYMSLKNPWDSTVYVGSLQTGKVFLEARFLDHGNTFSVKWLSEKLLFVQIWWGRLESSDVIIDVDQGKFLYNELANYGQLVQPCE